MADISPTNYVWSRGAQLFINTVVVSTWIALVLGLFYAAIQAGETREFYGEVIGFSTIFVWAPLGLWLVRLAWRPSPEPPDQYSVFEETCFGCAECEGDSDSDYDDDDRPNYWATGNYDPERYGQFVRSTSESTRDYIRDAYGDLDTWEANRPD